MAALPLVQAARNRGTWIQTVVILTVSIVVVSALVGAMVGAPVGVLASLVGSRRNMALLMQPLLIGTGLLMLVIALGELGLMRRLLPSINLVRADLAPQPLEGYRYRYAALLGAGMAATFGVSCTKPLYLVLLIYISLVGSVTYGALTMALYGLGLSTSIALVGLALRPAGRLARLASWLSARESAFHFIQGVIFAAFGAMSVAFFWLRYVIPTS